MNEGPQVHIDLHRVLRPYSIVILLAVPQWSYNVIVVEIVVEIYLIVIVLGGSAVLAHCELLKYHQLFNSS